MIRGQIGGVIDAFFKHRPGRPVPMEDASVTDHPDVARPATPDRVEPCIVEPICGWRSPIGVLPCRAVPMKDATPPCSPDIGAARSPYRAEIVRSRTLRLRPR